MTANWATELWRYRELLLFFVWRDIKIKYKQSLLGIGWAVLQPLLAMLIFTIFFGRLANMPSDGLPYPVFSYSGLLPWTYFAASIAAAGNSLVSNSNMLTKVYFPRMALPIAAVLSGLLDLTIAAVLLGILLIVYDIQLSWWLALLPVLVFAMSLLAAGIGMFLAALHVRYRDVKYAVPFLLQLWMFVTPVIYPVSLVPERFRFLLALNPMAGIIDAFRVCISPGRQFDLALVGTSLIAVVILCIAGVGYFHRTERWFADII